MTQYRIGIDVGGTKTAYGLFREGHLPLDRYEERSPYEADGPAFSDMLIRGIHSLLERNGLTLHDLTGVGVCMPSYILHETGYIYLTSSLDNIHDFAMRDYLYERLRVPVVLDNDSNCAALAEHRYGAGRGAKHMVYMAVSTGLGSGLILNGELFHGSFGWAGESGHMLITPGEGPLCGCHNRGCFMSWSSGKYFTEHARRLAQGKETALDVSRPVTGKDVLKACRENDPVALELLDQTANYVGLCVFNIYQLLNVDLFVFGGGLTHFGDLLMDRIRSVFDRYNHVKMPVRFKTVELERDFGIVGAAELVRTAPSLTGDTAC